MFSGLELFLWLQDRIEAVVPCRATWDVGDLTQNLKAIDFRPAASHFSSTTTQSKDTVEEYQCLPIQVF